MSQLAPSTDFSDPTFRAEELRKDPLGKFFRDALKDGWRAALKPYGTFQSIMLKPTMRFNSVEEAKAWANKVFDELEKVPAGGKAPLDVPFQRAGDADHVTMIMTTEFAFNGFSVKTGTKTKTMFSGSHPVDARFARAAVNEIRSRLYSPKYWGRNIVFAISSCKDFGPIDPSDPLVKKGDRWGENSIDVVSSKSAVVQNIKKFSASTIDGWDKAPSKFLLVDGKRPDLASKRDPLKFRLAKEDVDGNSRREAHTYLLEEFGAAGEQCAIGLGTCLDSKLEIYPGCNFLAFLSGRMSRAAMKMKESAPGATAAGPQPTAYMLNDTNNWVVEDGVVDPKDTDPAGLRVWDKDKVPRNLKIGGNRATPAEQNLMENASQIKTHVTATVDAIHNLALKMSPPTPTDAGDYYASGRFDRVGDIGIISPIMQIPDRDFVIQDFLPVSKLTLWDILRFKDHNDFDALKKVVESVPGAHKAETLEDMIDIYRKAKDDAAHAGRFFRTIHGVESLLLRDARRVPPELKDVFLDKMGGHGVDVGDNDRTSDLNGNNDALDGRGGDGAILPPEGVGDHGMPEPGREPGRVEGRL